jgi:UDP-N-acetylglucosamine:LPS N-acetylglucosamine transferase
MVKTVLFVAYGGGHINMLIPLIKAMRTQKKYKVITLALTTASISLEKYDIPYIGYKDIIDSNNADAMAMGQELASSFEGAMLVDRNETIAYLGLSFFDLVERYGKNEADAQYLQKGRAAFLPLTVMERLLRKIKPDLVISTNSPRTEKAVLLEAQKLSIPAICLVDLFDPREIKDRLGKQGYGSKICVFSEGVKNNLIKSGRLPKEVEVTGNPDFDELNSDVIKNSALEYRRSKTREYEHIVLWVRHAGKPNFELNGMIDDALIKIAKKNSTTLFVFRPHPNEPKEYSGLPSNIRISTLKDNIQILLLSSDLVLTIASTVGLQAVACNIPLITFDMGPTAKYTPYSKMGMSYGIEDLNELEKCIFMVLNLSVKRTMSSHAGFATQRVLDVASGLLSD